MNTLQLSDNEPYNLDTKSPKGFILSRMRKSIVVALYGHILERYEVTLYGYLSTLLVPLFFPQQDSVLSFLFGMGAFAAGYLMRPLGGFFFGYIGDLYGRKKALLNSILLVSIPTLIIGLLPTYETWGIVSPILLILCRLLQGLCVGGEYSGSAVYFFESSHIDRRGFSGSLMSGTAFCGAIIGSLVGTLCSFPSMPTWGWRIPFLLGACLGIIGFFIRRNMQETPLYSEDSAARLHSTTDNPFKMIMLNEKRNILCTMFIGATGYVCLYTSTIYLSSVIARLFTLPSFAIMLLNTLLLCSWVACILLTGYLSDKIGQRCILRLSAYGMIFLSFPFFYYISASPNLPLIISFQIILSLLGASFFGVAAGFVPSLFSLRQRYTGVAIGLNLGQALLGGTTPFIATLLVYLTDLEYAPAFFLILAGVVASLATHSAEPSTDNNKLMTPRLSL